MVQQQARRDDWYRSTVRAVGQSCPEARHHAVCVVERLSRLFLSRLPSELGIQLLQQIQDPPFCLHGRHSQDRTVGYVHFVETAVMSMSFSTTSKSAAWTDEAREDLGRSLTDSFLGAVGRELPSALRAEILKHLPAEIAFRMGTDSEAGVGLVARAS